MSYVLYTSCLCTMSDFPWHTYLPKNGTSFMDVPQAREFTCRWKTTGWHQSKQKNKLTSPTFSQHFATQVSSHYIQLDPIYYGGNNYLSITWKTVEKGGLLTWKIRSLWLPFWLMRNDEMRITLSCGCSPSYRPPTMTHDDQNKPFLCQNPFEMSCHTVLFMNKK